MEGMATTAGWSSNIRWQLSYIPREGPYLHRRVQGTGRGNPLTTQIRPRLQANRNGQALHWSSTAAVLWSLSGFFTQVPQLDVWPKQFRSCNRILARCLCARVAPPARAKSELELADDSDDDLFRRDEPLVLTAMVLGSPANTIWLQVLGPSWS